MQWETYRFYYADHVHIPLSKGHRFPIEKYRLLREALLREKIISPSELHPAPAAEDKDILLAHDFDYVMGLKNKTLDQKQLRPIGLTWSDELLQRSYCSVGGFIAATEAALEAGFSALLAGGTHHAHADRGEGYCVFNDFAVAALRLLKNKRVKKVLIIDLDVHQGNGNSSILGKRDDVFVMSIHGEKNFPFRKVPSHLDIALPEGTDDESYLLALEEGLREIDEVDFDIIFYQAGVDNLKEDSLGTFNLSFAGLIKRDEKIFEFAKRKKKPLAMAIGGGYAKPIELTVEAHVNTFKTARRYFA
jgi:acetoin utilization deacetylase AcuC-like enzyme